MRGCIGRFCSLLLVVFLGACGGSNTAQEHDRAIVAGKPFHYQIQPLVDSDAPVTYEASLEDGRPLPAWLQFNSATRTFSGIAPDDLAGIASESLRVQVVAAGAMGPLAKASFALRVMQSTSDAPLILNPAEELTAFDPNGLLRWSSVAGADAYEVWAYRDAGLTQLAEFSKALTSRQYQFTQLAGGQTYWIKLYFRANGVWREAPTFTITTTSNVTKARLLNSQEELEAFGPSGTLRWTAVAGADVYELWIYRDAARVAFAETSGPVRITQYQITSLTPGTTYYVQVYARVNGQYTAGGALQLTVTNQLDRARILNPQEELDAFATNGLLRWSPVTGATAYELWIFTNPNSSEIHESSGSLNQRSYQARTLQPGKVYYAQAYALVNGQWQVGSPVKITTTSTPTKARLTTPQEELENFSTTGTLRWAEVPGASAYELWIYGNAGLGTIIESGANPDRSYTVRRLCGGATYYVQVHALVNGVWTVGWATRLDVTQGTSLADCAPPAPQVTLAATPIAVPFGENATLTWSTKFATSCIASGGWSGAKALSGQESVGPLTKNSLFTLSCTGPNGSYKAETLVMVEGFTAGKIPERYYVTPVVNPGYIARLGYVLELDAGLGTGRLLGYDPFNGVGSNEPFIWSIPNGRLVVDFSPAPVSSSYVTIQSAYDSGWLTDAEYQRLLSSTNTGQLQIDRRVLRHTYSRKPTDNSLDTVMREERVEITAPPVQLNDGSSLTLAKLPVVEVSSETLVMRSSRDVTMRPFVATCPAPSDAVCVPGIWGGIYVYTPGNSSSGQPYPEAAYGELLTFVAGGSVTGRLSGRKAGWIVQGDGSLVINYPNGWTHRLQVLDSLGVEYGIVSDFTNGIQRYAHYDLFVKPGVPFSFTQASVANAAGHFWQSDINGPMPFTRDDNGDRKLEWLAGWKLDAPGPVAQSISNVRAGDCDGDGPDDIVARGQSAMWSLGSDGVLSLQYKPGSADRLRSWYPIAGTSSDGDRVFYVVESERYISGGWTGRLAFPTRVNILHELDVVWSCTD